MKLWNTTFLPFSSQMWNFVQIWCVSGVLPRFGRSPVKESFQVDPPNHPPAGINVNSFIYRTFDIFIVFCINFHDFRIVLLHHNWNSCALFQLSRTAVDSAGYFVLKPGMIAFELHCVLWKVWRSILFDISLMEKFKTQTIEFRL